MKRIAIISAALVLAIGGYAASQQLPDGTPVDIDGSIVLTSSSATALDWTTTDTVNFVDYGHGRDAPVDFEVHIQNAKAALRNGKVRLTDGDVHIHMVFRSGDAVWSAEIPLERRPEIEDAEAN